MVFDLEGQFSAQTVEELACMDVMMPYFAAAGRHSFFDDAELRLFDQVPTIAIWSPGVVFGVLLTEELGWPFEKVHSFRFSLGWPDVGIRMPHKLTELRRLDDAGF